jgi:hypothetical protein
MDPYLPPPGSRGISVVLEEALSHLSRLTPHQALGYLTSSSASGLPAVLVDIRPVAQRAKEGQIKGALFIERNVLEWRFDPTSHARLKVADRYDLRVIVICQEGYTSSLVC